MNPVAGQHDPEKTQAALEERFAKEQQPYELRKTTANGDAHGWVREAAASGFDMVVVAGGDGTMTEAVGGAVQAKSPIPLLQIPLGTANILARALGGPQDESGALDLLFSGRPQPFDVGYLPQIDRYFIVAAGAGFDARMVRDTTRERKNRWGVLAYLFFAVRHLFTLRLVRADLELDGKRQRAYASSIVVANMGNLGLAGITLGPDITPHDGRLDLVVAHATSVLGALTVLTRMITGRFPRTSDVRYLSASKVRIHCRPSLPVHVDGEMIGRTPFEAEVVPSGVQLLVAADYRADQKT